MRLTRLLALAAVLALVTVPLRAQNSVPNLCSLPTVCVGGSTDTYLYAGLKPFMEITKNGTVTMLNGATLPIAGLALGTNVATFLGTNLPTAVATYLATPSSANLLGTLSDATGTGAAVFANTPTFVTPILGAATGTSVALSGTNASSSFTRVQAGDGTVHGGFTLQRSNATPVNGDGINMAYEIGDNTGPTFAVISSAEITDVTTGAAEYYLSLTNAGGTSTAPLGVTPLALLMPASSTSTTLDVAKGYATPTIASGQFGSGTSASIAGAVHAFRLTLGTSPGTSGTVTFGQTFTNTPIVVCTAENVVNQVTEVAPTTTNVLITYVSGTSGNKIDCMTEGF